ncbi:cobalamin-binding protein [Arenicella chitinivorans]|uniref:Cobalamin-binding protein n=1 Tax=Arenicella chitinivorans TaxID=1329800 RepID=A0A918VJJ0_9GAMM|nr:cobalamin-binding protein [Arenicella chitinivorans]GHA02426.1 cobalamin-binding protein [Arenicella chitinivorans]
MRRLIVFSLLLLVACQQETQTTKQIASDTSVSVVDFSGATVTLKKPAERIVSLAPHITENIYSAGAGNKLIGVVSYSDYPAAVTDLPLVGGYASINVEKIIELQPDLIISWESGNSTASIQQLQALGYPVYIDQPDTLADVAHSIKDIGVLSGTTAEAARVAENFLISIKEIEEQYKSKPTLKTFYQVWNDPLQTINGTHIISDAIALCGGVNIYADEAVIAPVINIESILERNPDAIIASGMSSARPDWLDEWYAWPSINAVQNDHLFFVDPDHIQRHTVRILLGINTICKQLDAARTPSEL